VRDCIVLRCKASGSGIDKWTSVTMGDACTRWWGQKFT
jgi:hypothetical protein